MMYHRSFLSRHVGGPAGSQHAHCHAVALRVFRSGTENYIKAFQTNGYTPRKVEERPPILAVFAQDDLVITVPPENWKPGQSKDAKSGIHTNMYRLKDGKIVAMWVGGTT